MMHSSWIMANRTSLTLTNPPRSAIIMAQIEGCSSVGRASVSKTECREFEPCHPCQAI